MSNIDERKIAEAKATYTQMLGMVGFQTPENGSYWFAVHYNGELLGSARLIVDFQTAGEKNDEHTSGQLGSF